MIHTIFFDIDGTLVSHAQHAVPASTRSALDKLSKKGIKRVVATGRHILELAALPVRDIDFDGYITLNGQLCLDGQRNVISVNGITGSDKKHIVQMFAEKTIPVMLVEKEAMYLNFVDRHVEAAQRAISTRIPDVREYTGNDIYQAVVYLEKGKECAIADRLPGCKITRWNDYAVDVIPRLGGKASGIKKYLAVNQIRREETAAFGDGENDIEMLKFVQVGIAMGNADDLVKENADFVAAGVDDDGIEKALIQLGVIE